MKTDTQNISRNDPTSLAAVVRSPEEGPNYQPHWRWLFVQQHLAEIYDDEKPGDASVKLARVLDREKDEIIRKTLEFHCGASMEDNEAVEYALRTDRTPAAAIKIKAMVVADRSIDQIASQFDTHPAKIEFFEKLFFYVRPYLTKRQLLETICTGEGGHRLLEAALERGWPGVEETLCPRPPSGPRDLAPIISAFLDRSRAYARNLEASNTPPSKEDVQELLSVSHASGHFSPLEDTVEPQPLADTETSKKVAALTPVGRERVLTFIRTLLDGAARKVAEQDLAASNSSNDSPANPEHATKMLEAGDGPDDPPSSSELGSAAES